MSFDRELWQLEQEIVVNPQLKEVAELKTWCRRSGLRLPEFSSQANIRIIDDSIAHMFSLGF